MGESKYKPDVEQLFRKSPLVSYNSIVRTVKSKSGGTTYAKRMINYMTKKGLIKRITKGYYTSSEDISLAVLCFQPAYLGLQDALSSHNLWEQESIPIIVTPRNVRSGIRKILDRNVLIRKIGKKYFFGMGYHQQGNISLPYSDIEKTFIDMIYFKEHLSDEAIRNIKQKLNRKKLDSYLKRYPPRFRKKALKLAE